MLLCSLAVLLPKIIAEVRAACKANSKEITTGKERSDHHALHSRSNQKLRAGLRARARHRTARQGHRGAAAVRRHRRVRHRHVHRYAHQRLPQAWQDHRARREVHGKEDPEICHHSPRREPERHDHPERRQNVADRHALYAPYLLRRRLLHRPRTGSGLEALEPHLRGHRHLRRQRHRGGRTRHRRQGQRHRLRSLRDLPL